MKIVFAGLAAASTLAIAALASVPADAQGVSVGPGIGIAGSVDPYSGSRLHSHDDEHGSVYQGRSVHRDRAVRGRAHRHRYEQYDDDHDELDGF